MSNGRNKKRAHRSTRRSPRGSPRTQQLSPRPQNNQNQNQSTQLIPMYNDNSFSGSQRKVSNSYTYSYSYNDNASQGYQLKKRDSGRIKPPPPPPPPKSKRDSLRSKPPPPPGSPRSTSGTSTYTTQFTLIEPNTLQQMHGSSRSIINPQQFTFIEYKEDDDLEPMPPQQQQQKPIYNHKQSNYNESNESNQNESNHNQSNYNESNHIHNKRTKRNGNNANNTDRSNKKSRNEAADPFNTTMPTKMPLPKCRATKEEIALEDLHDLIVLYQQAVHDVHQALLDVKETSQDMTYKIKSVTEQLHMIIDRREDEILDEITKKTASKVFALDSQFTKLSQRLMFCCEARNEAKELLTKEQKEISKTHHTQHKQNRKRDHSVSTMTNYNARKERIMAIVNKAKHDAKTEFEEELNRGTPVVTTRFHIEHYDITQELEKLGSIIEDEPLQQYQIYPPAITKTKAFKRSVRVAIKCREKIDHEWEHQVLSCQFEPQFVLTNEESKETDRNKMKSNNVTNMEKRASIVSLPEHLSNPSQLKWETLGWIELNPAPATTQMFNKPQTKMMEMNELRKVMSLDRQTLQMEMPLFGDPRSAPIMSNLEKLKKEMDLDHIVSEYTKLITGLNDILNDADGKYVYLRVRMRKLVKFEEDVHCKKKKKRKHIKLKHIPMSKSSSRLEMYDHHSNGTEEVDDYAPIWVESLFSRPVRLSMKNLPTNYIPKINVAANENQDNEDKFDDDFDEETTKQRKKKKRKHKKRKSKRDTKRDSVSSKGSLYESDSEFTKQRRHSNYHIQDELYQPGILLLEKSRIIWHDIVNNRATTVSDAIPVAARSSCGMVVAHDVLVADDEEQDQKRDHVSDGTDVGGRYTSIMFRLGGTLNKKADRSVDMLDLGTGMWSSLPSLKHARAQCPPALMNGNIICAGGCGRKSKPLSSVELFDFEEARWTQLASLKQARWGHAAYVMYYEDNDEIARSPSLVSSNHSSCESAKFIVAGGWSKKRKNLATAELYDFASNQWQSIAPMNVARSRCVAMEWTSIDRVGVIGGWGDNTKIVEYYDSVKDCWYQLKDLNHEHIYPSCGLLSDQHLYAMNRFLESDAKMIINERKKQQMQQMQHIHHKVSMMRGRPAPFVLGSNDQLGCLELFDDRSDQWIILQTFSHSQDIIISMIECALPSNVTSTLTQRTRGLSRTSQSSQSSFGVWQRRSSKILGML